MFRNVCRLCLGTDDLLWIFDKRMADNMMEIIHVTSGVEITKMDSVTQMVCSTCCQITIKMFKFRTTSIKNDKELKARCAGYNISQLTNSAITCKPILTDNKESPPVAPPKPVFRIPARYRHAHPSVRQVIRKNPNIQLPEECLKSHVGAYITLLTDEVDEWFKEKNMSDSEIEKLKQEAYEYAKLTTKSDPAMPKKRKLESREEKPEEKKWKRIKSLPTLTKQTEVEDDSDEKFSKITITLKCEGKSSHDTNNKAPELSVTSTIHKSVRSLRETVKTRDKSISPHPHNTRRRSSANSENSVKSVDVNISVSAAKSNVDTLTETVNSDKPKNDDANAETVKPTNNVPTQVESSVPLGPILNSLLVTNNCDKKKQPSREVITLKSLLRSHRITPKVTNILDEVINIDPDELPSTQIETPQQVRKEQPDDGLGTRLIVPEREFELFTSRPFLNDKIAEGDQLIVSDDDEQQAAEKSTGNNSDNDPLLLDLDSPSCSNFSSTSGEKTDKTTFTESLNLMPKTSELTNMPDLSLVSLASKSVKLYTCKVCDSQHSSLKELKYHERRTHTKCPFCSKRFRTLANRDEHVKFFCAINSNPVELKAVKLDLVRIDEVEEIRKRYPSAFEERTEEVSDVEIDIVNVGDQNVIQEVPTTGDQNVSKEVSITPDQNAIAKVSNKDENVAKKILNTGSQNVVKKVLNTANQKRNESVISSVVECDPATRLAVNELEKFLNYAEVVHVKKKPAKVDKVATKKKKIVGQPRKTEDVICISDEESEPVDSQQQPEASTQQETTAEPEKPQLQIKVVNCDILKNINLHDNDVNVLKRILTQAKLKTESSLLTLKDSPIIGGNSSRVKIFKNLRKHLYHYKIPIDVKYSSTIAVDYKPTKPPPAKNVNDLWYTMTPNELRPRTTTQKMQPVATQSPSYTILSSNCPVTKSSQQNVTPIVAKQPQSSTTAATFQPLVATTTTNPTRSIATASYQPVVATTTINPTRSIVTTNYQPVVATATVTPQQPTTVPTFTLATMQNSVVSTGNLLFTTRSPLMTTATNASSTPMVLNGTQSLCTTSASSNFTNIILVPSTLIQNEVTLPAVQGPLPVIHSVTSAIDFQSSTDDNVAKLASITNALMPVSQTTNINAVTSSAVAPMPSVVPQPINYTLVDEPLATLLPTQPPAIRVKNLQELS